ncbi:uncharacterized protein LOC119893839 isoform X2 [Micropterus salmoides]|uniref:uncharacterized protein LOC119893839 isoform X2 n=1 Tax=Micropterus salmoides TaxID=27706 RepID=UPI0018EE2944|nr:uncharacterized protein LOC119893839 isoform X2 [Micropterus salmoides]
MDPSADSGTPPTHTTVGGPVLGHELSMSSARCQTESGGNILLQLLEFKTHLLEAVEELHIRRDAETRFEDQISKLVLEKQELEWEKESLQYQSETVANQHTESLINVKKQFQAKIRKIEEEKGKYQASAELKDKEINNLKEELKSLQLLKYNLEKKSGELEQKLALQSRSKDSHLNQLGEVEKRFSALSWQCAIVKQAHEKLEQNVNEAMKINDKLTSANGRQEATIVSLKKELEEVSTKLIKTKMASARHDKTHSPTGGEQRIQHLKLKLNMETEINKKLVEENVAVRAEKQEVMRSLQHTQQLMLSQTQAVSRVELELQTQREQYQGLKQEHRVKSKAMEDKVAQLMESYAASKTSWDKEKAVYLDRIKSEQQDLQAVKEAYYELHQKYTELSSQAKVQAQHVYELEMRHSSQSLSVSTHILPTFGDEALNEPISSSELPSFSSVQHMASTQTKNPDSLEDTGAVTTLVATGSARGQDTPDYHQQSQFEQSLNLINLFSCPLTKNNHYSLSSLCGSTGSDTSAYMNNSNTRKSDPDVVQNSEFIHTTYSVSCAGLQISKGSCVSDAPTVLNHRYIDGSADLRSKEMGDEGNGGMSEKEQGLKDDVKEGGRAGEERGTLMAQTADRADTQEDSQRSREDAGDTTQPETETKFLAGGEGTDGAEERGKTGLHVPESPQTQIPAQTTTEKSDAQKVIDFMDTEPPLAACEPSDCSQRHSQKVSEKEADCKEADCSHVNKGYDIRREVQTLCSGEHQSVRQGPSSVIQAVQRLCHDEAQTVAESLTQLPSPIHQVFDKTTEEKPSDKLAANIPTDVSEPLNQSSICGPQTNTAPAAPQSDGIVNTQELETTTTQTQPSNRSDTTSDMKQTDEMCNTYTFHLSECELVRTVVEPQALPHSQEVSEQETGQLESLVTDDEEGDSSAIMKRESQSNADTRENDASGTTQKPMERSNLKDAGVDIVVDLESEGESGSCQEHMKSDETEEAGDAKTTKCETDVNLSAHPSHKNDASPEAGTSKCCEQSPAKKVFLDETNESPLPSNKTYRSSFDWGSAQRKTGSPMSEQNISDPGGLLGHPPSTIPMFLKSKHSKVPLVITRASDLLNAFSVSGTAAYSRRHQQGEWKALGETCRETATADMDSRVSMSSFPVSTSSTTVSRLSWQTTAGCSRAPTSAAVPSFESDWEPSRSQEREDQQSSFRAQISKIEQFLNSERLRLPKRRRTDN